MSGYSEANCLDATWLQQLPRFFRFRDLILMVFCFKKFDPSNLQPGEARILNQIRSNLAEDSAVLFRDLLDE
jgi:hypothetical protein